MTYTEMLEVTVSNIGKHLSGREYLDTDGAERLTKSITDLTRVLFLSSLPANVLQERPRFAKEISALHSDWADLGDD